MTGPVVDIAVSPMSAFLQNWPRCTVAPDDPAVVVVCAGALVVVVTRAVVGGGATVVVGASVVVAASVVEAIGSWSATSVDDVDSTVDETAGFVVLVPLDFTPVLDVPHPASITAAMRAAAVPARIPLPFRLGGPPRPLSRAMV